jgi:hypothetical protein
LALQSPQRMSTLIQARVSQSPSKWWMRRRCNVRVHLPLIVCHLGRTSLVGNGVDVAPSRSNEPVVSAAVFSLNKVAHGVESTATNLDFATTLGWNKAERRLVDLET